MKKIVLFFVLFPMIFILTACDPPMFDHRDLSGEILSVEYIKYSAENDLTKQNLPEFDFTNINVIAQLSSDKIDDFSLDLSKIFIVKYYNKPNSHDECCIKVNMKDETFEVISKNRLIVKYDKNGEVLEYIGMLDDKNDFERIVNKYFPSSV